MQKNQLQVPTQMLEVLGLGPRRQPLHSKNGEGIQKDKKEGEVGVVVVNKTSRQKARWCRKIRDLGEIDPVREARRECVMKISHVDGGECAISLIVNVK